jgi:hypothetical protein
MATTRKKDELENFALKQNESGNTKRHRDFPTKKLDNKYILGDPNPVRPLDSGAPKNVATTEGKSGGDTPCRHFKPG